jgi:hypothetical protein
MLGRHSTWKLRAAPANAVAIRGPTVRNKSATTSANVVERQKALSASPPVIEELSLISENLDGPRNAWVASRPGIGWEAPVPAGCVFFGSSGQGQARVSKTPLAGPDSALAVADLDDVGVGPFGHEPQDKRRADRSAASATTRGACMRRASFGWP